MVGMNEEGVKAVLREYKYYNSRVVIREDVTHDQFLDVLLGQRIYVLTLTVLNKIDMVDGGYLDDVRESCGHDLTPISAESGVNPGLPQGADIPEA